MIVNVDLDDPKLDEVLYLLSVYAGKPICASTFYKARDNLYLKFDEYKFNPAVFKLPYKGQVELSSAGNIVISNRLAEMNAKQISPSGDRFEQLAEKVQNEYPEGRRAGTQYMWRDSKRIIASRLKKFFLKWGEYTDDEIVDATRRYVASFNGDYRYMQLLKYFIWKNEVIGNEVELKSTLASYLENDDNTESTNWEDELV